MSDKTAPTSRELADEIQQLKDDMALLKVRFAVPPGWELEQALAHLAVQGPLTAEEKSGLFEEIQQFKNEVSALKTQILQTGQKLAPVIRARASPTNDE